MQTINLDLLNLHCKVKYEIELRNFFLSDFSIVTACVIYANVAGFKNLLKQDLALEFSRNQNLHSVF